MAVRILEMLLQLPQDDEPEFGKKEPAPILYTRDKWPSDIVYENVHSPLVTATTQTDGGMTPYVRLVRALHRRPQTIIHGYMGKGEAHRVPGLLGLKSVGQRFLRSP